MPPKKSAWQKTKSLFTHYPSQVVLAWVLFGLVAIIGGSLIFKTVNAQAADCENPGNVRGWGWNPYFGWISLSSANTGVSDGCYGVTVSDTADADGNYTITGYAWNGWGSEPGEGYFICFGETCNFDLEYSETPEDSSPPSAEYDPATNQVTGWARFVGWADDDGAWIKLDDGLTTPPNFGVKIYRKVVRITSENPSGFDNQWTFGSDNPADINYQIKNYSWNGGLGWIQWQPDTGLCYCDRWSDWDTNPSDTCQEIRTRDCITPIGGVGEIECSEWQSNPVANIGPNQPSIDDELDGSQCGAIKLGLTGCIVDLTKGDTGCSIYRSLSEDGCEFSSEGTECGVTSQTGGNCTLVAAGVAGADGEIVYSDTTIIPRVDCWYWAVAVRNGAMSVADDAGPGRTSCFPGSGSHE